MKKVFKIIFILFLLIALLALSFFCINYLKANSIKLDKDKLMKTFTNIKIYDKDLEVLESHSQYEYIPYENISKNTIKAFVSVEDRKFFNHNGYDFLGICRAVTKNLASMSYKEGASTITQQLVKNTLLTQDKKLSRKISELNLAVRLENAYSKEQIISMYLSAIYFGHNLFGLKDASNFYFGLSPSSLSISQSALLAGLVKSPNNYSPLNNIELCEKRRNIVLNCMLEENFISKEEYTKAINEEIVLSENATSNHSNSCVPYVIAEGAKILNLSQHQFRQSNFIVKTNYDSILAQSLDLEKLNIPCNMSLIVLDNNTNSIISLYENTPNTLNFARCPASLIKPLLVYAPAFEENLISPLSFILDKPTSFNGYAPKNYANLYYGNVTPRTALEKSLNIPAIKVYNSIPLDTRQSYAQDLAIALGENDGLSASLGSITSGISLNNLISAYATLAKYGTSCQASFIEEILNADGEIIYKRKPQNHQIFSQETSFIISDMLKDTAKSGTAKNLNKLDLNLSAKTGTNGNNSGNIDAYSVAYNEKYTVLAWLGNKDNTLLPNSIKGSSTPTDLVKITFLNLKTTKDDQMKKVENVELINIDKYALMNDNKILLASENTPEQYIMTEIYDKTKLLDIQTSQYFELPQVDDATLSFEKEVLKVKFKSKSIHSYEINYNEESYQIEGNGEQIVLDLMPNDNLEHYVQITPTVIFNNIKGETFTTNTIFTKENLSPPKDWLEKGLDD